MNTSLARGVNSRPFATLAGECIRLLRCRISSRGGTASVPTSSPERRAGDSGGIAPSSGRRARETRASESQAGRGEPIPESAGQAAVRGEDCARRSFR